MTQKRYAIAPEVAARFRTSAAQIYDWAREQQLPSNCILRIGRKLLFDLDGLDKWARRIGNKSNTTTNPR